MDLSFDVGVSERHRVCFSFRRLSGALAITVDGADVVRETRAVSPKRLAAWDFVVGERERHEVRIEKHRRGRLSRLRRQAVSAFIDGRLVAQARA